jgi:hypothetical protein
MYIFAVFFAFVLVAAGGGGYLVLRMRPAAEAAPVPAGYRLIGDPEPLSSSDFSPLAYALEMLGSLMPVTGTEADTMRKQLFRAGYRGPPHSPSSPDSASPRPFAIGRPVGGDRFQRRNIAGIPRRRLQRRFNYLLPVRVLQFRVPLAPAGSARPSPARSTCSACHRSRSVLDSAMLDTARSLRRVYPDLCAEFLFCHLEMRAGKSRLEALGHLANAAVNRNWPNSPRS